MTGRIEAPKRNALLRVLDWREVEQSQPSEVLQSQAERCMGCGVPFCHNGCPLGNDIPDWNAAVALDEWQEAAARLHATNNFPEFTGKTCPAPCEPACVRTLTDDAVTIRQIERSLAERAWSEGWIQPLPATERTGRSVGIVGSGPAGMAAAQQLARAGHDVVVYERDAHVGGLLRYGIPDFKLAKSDIDRRVQQLEAESVRFEMGVNVGSDVSLAELQQRHDAVLLATGAQKQRRLDVPGADLQGVVGALDYLRHANRLVSGESVESGDLYAVNKRVVILGGGDTGADCLGTALRQGASQVQHFHYKPAPPSARTEDMPWPWWPMILRDSSSHEEGGERGWSLVARGFEGEGGQLKAMRLERVQWTLGADGRSRMESVPGSLHSVDVDLALIAVGFVGVEPIDGADIARDDRGRIAADARSFETETPGIWACGDARRGASLVVWAIREGRDAAEAIDRRLRK
ncbi:MAG: glutamate synthase subunit beta [Myxococcales bacterium]|nr:glutamate synthase subunit beta [Myxococcales bacterium]